MTILWKGQNLTGKELGEGGTSVQMTQSATLISSLNPSEDDKWL